METEEVVSSVEGVLLFGLERIRACRRTDDLKGAQLLMERTQGLKALQEIWRD